MFVVPVLIGVFAQKVAPRATERCIGMVLEGLGDAFHYAADAWHARRPPADTAIRLEQPAVDLRGRVQSRTTE